MQPFLQGVWLKFMVVTCKVFKILTPPFILPAPAPPILHTCRHCITGIYQYACLKLHCVQRFYLKSSEYSIRACNSVVHLHNSLFDSKVRTFTTKSRNTVLTDWDNWITLDQYEQKLNNKFWAVQPCWWDTFSSTSGKRVITLKNSLHYSWRCDSKDLDAMSLPSLMPLIGFETHPHFVISKGEGCSVFC